jgi:hypothetical protein
LEEHLMSVTQTNVTQSAGCSAVRARKADDQLQPRGKFVVEHFRDGRKIGHYEFPNGITNEGKNKLLDVMFHGVSAITTWWLGMIDNSSYTALAAGDTYANIGQAGNGWHEFTSYTDAANAGSASTRPEWTEGAASSQTITNAGPVVFDITDSGAVKGLFLVGGAASAQNKSDHTASGAVLWATALFNTGDVPVNANDQLKVTYTVSA